MTRIKTKLQSVITMQRYTYSYRVRHLDNFTNFTNTRASQIAHRIRSHIVQFVETIYILKRFYFSRLKECVSTENSHDPPSSYYYYYYYIYILFLYYKRPTIDNQIYCCSFSAIGSLATLTSRAAAVTYFELRVSKS